MAEPRAGLARFTQRKNPSLRGLGLMGDRLIAFWVRKFWGLEALGLRVCRRVGEAGVFVVAYSGRQRAEARKVPHAKALVARRHQIVAMDHLGAAGESEN